MEYRFTEERTRICFAGYHKGQSSRRNICLVVLTVDMFMQAQDALRRIDGSLFLSTSGGDMITVYQAV